MDESNKIVPSGAPESTEGLPKPAIVESVPHATESRVRQSYSQKIDADDGINLFEYWRLLRRRQGTLILSMFLGLLAAILVTLPQTRSIKREPLWRYST